MVRKVFWRSGLPVVLAVSFLLLVLVRSLQAQGTSQPPLSQGEAAIDELYTRAAPTGYQDRRFEALSAELIQMERFYSGGSGQAVRFDGRAALAAGFSRESVRLAEQLARYTNAILEGAATQGALRAISAESYPLVAEYFHAATMRQIAAERGGGINSSINAPNVCLLGAGACTCGHWLNPKPSRAASWRSYFYSNPTQTLTNWGYHATPNLAGGGWTRAESYYPFTCGINTFRDHAYTVGTREIREQNYNAQGIYPGEPNPEVWRSGPWPYATWPAYVLWWHQSGPGR